MRIFNHVRRKTALLLAGLLLITSLGAFALWAGNVWPEATGDVRYAKGDLTVDASHKADGYIMAKASPTDRRLKLRVTQGNVTMTYDLNNSGQYEVFPLQMGSGSYTVGLFRNVKGNRYTQQGQISFSVQLNGEYAAFLCPNQYVNYSDESEAVALSNELCAGLTTDQEKLDAIRGYIRKNLVYDYVKATMVPAGTLPDVDGCLKKHMGICQDLAALMCCMLRVQGVPTQFVIGYANNTYHAWTNVLIDGEFQRIDPTADINAIAKDAEYTTERIY